MGRISRKIQATFKRRPDARHNFRRMAYDPPAGEGAPVKTREQLIEDGFDPLHAVYLHAQNLTSLFVEGVSGLPFMEEYARTVMAAEDTYLPQGPPMSPVTRSFFNTWLALDLRFGPDAETMAKCHLDMRALFELTDDLVAAVQGLSRSCMGFYEHAGTKGGRVLLRDLAGGGEYPCLVPSGYTGHPGEVWYARRCPPVPESLDYHLILTTPYVMVGASVKDWTAYLKRATLAPAWCGADGKHTFLKHGETPTFWLEYVFQAYHHHDAQAVFLAGLPDVAGSRPHSPENWAKDDW